MRTTVRQIIGIVVLTIVVAAGLSGCKASLEPGGAYYKSGQQADMGLYAADSAFKFADTTLDFIFLFESENRDLLWKINPDIKHSMDAVRTKAYQYKKMYLDTRAEYLLHPAPEGLASLQNVLTKFQAIAEAAMVILPKNNIQPEHP